MKEQAISFHLNRGCKFCGAEQVLCLALLADQGDCRIDRIWIGHIAKPDPHQ